MDCLPKMRPDQLNRGLNSGAALALCGGWRPIGAAAARSQSGVLLGCAQRPQPRECRAVARVRIAPPVSLTTVRRLAGLWLGVVASRAGSSHSHPACPCCSPPNAPPPPSSLAPTLARALPPSPLSDRQAWGEAGEGRGRARERGCSCVPCGCFVLRGRARTGSRTVVFPSLW